MGQPPSKPPEEEAAEKAAHELVVRGIGRSCLCCCETRSPGRLNLSDLLRQVVNRRKEEEATQRLRSTWKHLAYECVPFDSVRTFVP
jgi:hypothetical protein